MKTDSEITKLTPGQATVSPMTAICSNAHYFTKRFSRSIRAVLQVLFDPLFDILYFK